MLLLKLSKEHDIFYMERKTYQDYKIYKSYIINIDGSNRIYTSKKELLTYLVEY